MHISLILDSVCIRLSLATAMEALLANHPNLGYNRKTSMISTKIVVPTDVTNTLLTSKRGKPLYCSKKWPKISYPKKFVIERFHCYT